MRLPRARSTINCGRLFNKARHRRAKSGGHADKARWREEEGYRFGPEADRDRIGGSPASCATRRAAARIFRAMTAGTAGTGGNRTRSRVGRSLAGPRGDRRDCCTDTAAVREFAGEFTCREHADAMGAARSCDISGSPVGMNQQGNTARLPARRGWRIGRRTPKWSSRPSLTTRSQPAGSRSHGDRQAERPAGAEAAARYRSVQPAGASSTPASAQVPRQSEQAKLRPLPADAAQAPRRAVPGIGQSVQPFARAVRHLETDSNPSRGGSEDPKPARPVSAASGSESGAPPEAPQQTFGSWRFRALRCRARQTTGHLPRRRPPRQLPVSRRGQLSSDGTGFSGGRLSRPNPTAQVGDHRSAWPCPKRTRGASGQQVAIRMVQKGARRCTSRFARRTTNWRNPCGRTSQGSFRPASINLDSARRVGGGRGGRRERPVELRPAARRAAGQSGDRDAPGSEAAIRRKTTAGRGNRDGGSKDDRVTRWVAGTSKQQNNR